MQQIKCQRIKECCIIKKLLKHKSKLFLVFKMEISKTTFQKPSKSIKFRRIWMFGSKISFKGSC
jgi:hypothetical protein